MGTSKSHSFNNQTSPILIVMITAVLSALPAFAQTSGWSTSGHGNLWTGNGAPAGRTYMTSVWTGETIVVFAGRINQPPHFNNGGVYDAVIDGWLVKPILTAGFGIARDRPVACWTGDTMLVWGGMRVWDEPSRNSGLAYSPSLDQFLPKPNLEAGIGAPKGSWGGLAAFHEGKMVVWGGHMQVLVNATMNWWDPQGVYEGGVYDPSTDTWEVRPGINSEVSLEQHNDGLAWADGLIYSRGGLGGLLNTYWQSDLAEFRAGGVFDVAADQWISLPNLKSGSFAPHLLWRGGTRMTWTGLKVLEFGGAFHNSQYTESVNVGRAYSLASDTFLQRPALDTGLGAPTPRLFHSQHWTGSHLWVWGGGRTNLSVQGSFESFDSGGIYNPDSDSWLHTPSLDAPVRRTDPASVWTGDRVLGWGGYHVEWPTSSPPALAVYHTDGYVYHPPRVAPSIRNLSATDPGASASNALTATVGERFKHRIVCYGTPEAALISSNLPSWLSIGFGGPGPLVAVGTGQGNGGQNGNPPGTGAPFSPWFSAEGLTADGQWLHGTPGPGDVGTYAIQLHAHNGVAPDSATHTVYIEVLAPPGGPSFTTPVPPNAAIAGELYSAPVAAVGPPPVTSIQLSGHPWLSYANGVVSGIPPVSAGGTTQGPFILTASNGHPPDATQLFNLTVAHAYTDINRDRAVNVTDVQLTVNIILGLTQPQWPDQGDANRDSLVNVIDVQQVVNKILNP